MKSVTVKAVEDIRIGDTAYFAKTITEADVMMFAQLSGDYAPHHVNKEFGATTLFNSRIAHGMLTAGLIGSVLTGICGAASYTKNQEMSFKSAVVLGDTITVRGEVTAIDTDNKTVCIDVLCTNQNWHEGDRPVIIAKFTQALDVSFFK